LQTVQPSALIGNTTKEAVIETRELVAWIAAAGGAGVTLVFIVLFLTHRREARRLRAAAAEAAGRDPLTNLLSRHAILGVLESEVARCLRGDSSLGVLMVVFERLSLVKEEHGRDAWDAVLVECARLVRTNVHVYDSVGRVGDEEILVVLPDCDEVELGDTAERVRMMIERGSTPWKGTQLRATVSIGGLTTIALDEKSADRLVRSADRLVAEARASGGNRVRITEPFDITEESNLGLPLENERRQPRPGVKR